MKMLRCIHLCIAKNRLNLRKKKGKLDMRMVCLQYMYKTITLINQNASKTEYKGCKIIYA